MVHALRKILNKNKKGNTINKCYFCGTTEDLTCNQHNGIYTCSHCRSLIENTARKIAV